MMRNPGTWRIATTVPEVSARGHSSRFVLCSWAACGRTPFARPTETPPPCAAIALTVFRTNLDPLGLVFRATDFVARVFKMVRTAGLVVVRGVIKVRVHYAVQSCLKNKTGFVFTMFLHLVNAGSE